MARPKKKKETKLTKEVRTLANRARVRMQELKKEMKRTGKLPYKTLTEIRDLQNSGLLTKSGNVSMKLPETKEKLNIVKNRLNKFLKGATTLKRVKEEHKKEELEKISDNVKELKAYLDREERNENEQEDEPRGKEYKWAYWQIAWEYGLFNKVDYTRFKLKINDIVNAMSVKEFEAYVYNFMHNMAESDNPYMDSATDIFFDTMGI